MCKGTCKFAYYSLPNLCNYFSGKANTDECQDVVKNMTYAFDLLDLSRQLKQERLFINSERDQLRHLNDEVTLFLNTDYRINYIEINPL